MLKAGIVTPAFYAWILIVRSSARKDGKKTFCALSSTILYKNGGQIFIRHINAQDESSSKD